jgi:hypothetical protein
MPDGHKDDAVTISAADAARSTGFPRMTRTADGVLLAWTKSGSRDELRIATVRVAKQ